MIRKEIKKIFKLSGIFLKNSYDNINIINQENNKLNKKSFLLWMLLFFLIAIFFISQKVIKILIDRNVSEIFINFYIFILSILIIFQTSLVVINVFYFSKDLEYILPLPIKPIELLIAKYLTLLYKIYIYELLFGIIPFSIYGLYTNSSILYYLYLVIVLIIFPIFLSIAISVVMMFFMKVSKFVKNKDIFQITVTFILIFFMIALQYILIGNILQNNNEVDNASVITNIEGSNRINNIGKYFLVINPSIKILTEANFYSIIDILKIICIDVIAFLFFIYIGKKTYLKDILKNTIYSDTKKMKNNAINRAIKKRKKYYSYIFKEFKILYRNPMYFIQCIFPVIALTFSFSILIIKGVPQFLIWLENEEFKNFIGNISFDITAIYVILGLMQFFFMISPTSLISVSKDGKNASFMKYIPMSLYGQFVCKGIPQIIINLVPITVLLTVIHFMIPGIMFKYILESFVLAVLLNIINSYSMVIVDLLNPKLNWGTDYDVLKQNNNKIIQYVFSIFIIIILIYFAEIFKEIDIDLAILITGIIFLFIIIIINILVKIKHKKIFKKII